MTLFHFTDAVALDGSVDITDRGLVAVAKTARTGVQEYLGSEVWRPDLTIARIERSADEVFHADALAPVRTTQTLSTVMSILTQAPTSSLSGVS